MDQTWKADWRGTLETLNRSLHVGLSRAEANAFRQRNLSRVAMMVAAQSEFYRQRLAPVMGKSDLRPERWNDIPILTKEELRANRDAILVTEPGPESGALRMGWTSGSEGEPLHYARTALSDYVSNQITQRFLRWWKLDGNRRLAQIHTTRQVTSKRAGPGVRRGWLSGKPAGEHHTYPVSADLQQHLAWLQEIRPAYLRSYPEVLYELARLALRQGRVLRFDLLISGGGVLTPDTRKLCKDAFGCAVSDFYGAEEVGGIAAECPACGEFHGADENVLLEIIKDDGRPARVGEIGRVVVTTLFNHAFPLIRYHIGDYVEAGGGTACTQPLQTIRRVLGRGKAIFRLNGGRMIWPYIPASELGRLANVKRYQFVQFALDALEFHYVPHNTAQGIDDVALQGLVSTFLDPSLKVMSIPVAAIERESNLKYMLYRSSLEGMT